MITETIYSGMGVVIPYADVAFIEKCESPAGDYIWVYLKNSSWDKETDTPLNAPSLYLEEKDKFLRGWCNYRHEIDQPDNLVEPQNEPKK
jgi:hypothetical protein